VSNSNLGGDTDYSELLVVFSVPSGKCQDSTLDQATVAPLSQHFQFIIHYHKEKLRHYTASITDNVVKKTINGYNFRAAFIKCPNIKRARNLRPSANQTPSGISDISMILKNVTENGKNT
jgi:hypothetical protein